MSRRKLRTKKSSREFQGAVAGSSVHGAAAVLLAAGVFARMAGSVLWCLRARDLFARALAGAGLHPDRVIYAEAGDEQTVLLCLEKGLRHGGLAGVVGETSRLSLTAACNSRKPASRFLGAGTTDGRHEVLQRDRLEPCLRRIFGDQSVPYRVIAV
jgi:hypothetical protein